MFSRFMIGTAVVVVAIGIAFPRQAAAQSGGYVVTDLGAIGGPQSSASSINGSGQIVGVSTLASANLHGVFYNGLLTDLGTLGTDTQSAGYAVNDAGQVVCVSYSFGNLQSHAMLWQGGTSTNLGNFSPRDINASGVVAGYLTTFLNNLYVDHACVWNAGVLTDLGTLGGRNSQVLAIDTAGRTVGQSYLADNMTLRACLWQGGTAHDLGTLTGGATANSSATSLNDHGQIVGWSDTASGSPHAFLVQVDSGGNVSARTDLGALAGTYSYAYGINSAGTAVGSSNSRAVLWAGGQISDLNASIPGNAGWVLTRATAINSSGQIVGEGLHFGFPHAFLLTSSTCLKGDVNGDGVVNGLDVQAFVEVFLSGGTPQQICAADMGAPTDGVVTNADLVSFVSCLLGIGSCN